MEDDNEWEDLQDTTTAATPWSGDTSRLSELSKSTPVVAPLSISSTTSVEPQTPSAEPSKTVTTADKKKTSKPQLSSKPTTSSPTSTKNPFHLLLWRLVYHLGRQFALLQRENIAVFGMIVFLALVLFRRVFFTLLLNIAIKSLQWGLCLGAVALVVCFLYPSPLAVLSGMNEKVVVVQYAKLVALVGYLLPTLLQIMGVLLLMQISSLNERILTTGVMIGATTAFWCQSARRSRITNWQQAWIVVYVITLVFLLTLHIWESTHSIRLLAAGLTMIFLVLVYSWSTTRHHCFWSAQTLQDGLRLALRDVLQHVQSVAPEQALELVMLRWIIEYWSFQKQEKNDTTSTSDNNSNTNGNTNLSWTDLGPMLQSASTQISNEKVELQQQTSNTSTTSSTGTTSLGTAPISMNTFEDTRHWFQTMDLDESAKPAVNDYKNAVNGFRPSRGMAAGLAVVSRCPAYLALLYGFNLQLPVVLLVLPLIYIEYQRVQAWLCSCKIASSITSKFDTPDSSSLRRELNNLDAMTIILLPEDFSITRHYPSLWIVWNNIEASVAALEMGLVTTRCVQTTVVAFDFASNLVSLAHLGLEVSRHGWGHGLTLLAQDLQSILDHTDDEPRYSRAAVDAVRNSQVLAKNANVLRQEPDLALSSLLTLLGRGWLWGRDAMAQSPNATSGVVIEELDDDSEADKVVVLDPENEDRSTKLETAVIEHVEDKCPDPTVRSDKIVKMSSEDHKPVASGSQEELEESVEAPGTRSVAENDSSSPWESLGTGISNGTRDNVQIPHQSAVSNIDELNQATKTEEEEEDHTPWVGLAVAGAAVGGIALSLMNSNNHDRKRRDQ